MATQQVGQRGRQFTPRAVALRPGETLALVNDDTRTHTIRIDDPRFSHSSGTQEPGDTVAIAFPEVGRLEVTCGIHPEMRLDVVVSAVGPP